jgi:hypothetical protein
MDASGQTTTIKAEVPYDMTKNPPAPIMSKNDPRRATRGSPKGSRIPDVVVVHDGTKPPTPPTLVLAIDQAEELFHAEGTEEARAFLDFLGKLAPEETPSLTAPERARRAGDPCRQAEE